MADDATRRSGGLQFSLLGMPVSVPLSGLLGVGLIAWLWAPTFGAGGTGLAAAVVFAVLLYAAILVHELAHGLTARGLGNAVHGITLWIFGGFTVYERANLTPGREAAIAASGPLATLGVAAAAQGLLMTVGTSLPSVAANILSALVWTNILLGVLNLLPGLPLDGGGIVRAVAWKLTGSEHRGTKVAAWSGRVLAVIVVVIPLGLAALPGSNLGLLTVVVAAVFGVFVWIGATASLRQSTLEQRIPELRAGSLARRAVPARTQESLALARQRMADAHAGAIVVIDDFGHPTGVVNETAASATPPDRRPWIPVNSLSTPLPARAMVRADVAGHDLIDALRQANAPAVIVVDATGAIYGVLFIDDVEQALA
ncbi:MAG: site-2 protease family protein [Actinobacteria bacterium]|nr:site-2 protease family protein [Actinomycetota bacterium]MCB9412522.1 site-2 protease family protein [Actinomycetota bacterium]